MRRQADMQPVEQPLAQQQNDQLVPPNNFAAIGSEIQLGNQVINANTIGEEAVTKLQQELESRVQKDLDQLTIIANNKYAKGHHVFDY